MYYNAHSSLKGMNTGEPNTRVRHTWRQVHERSRRVAGGLAAADVGHGDAVAVLAGAPVEIAPTAQGTWMRGSSLTMLHQPTPRTDLKRWAEETTAIIKMIDAKAVVVSDPFMAAAPLLSQHGMRVLTVEQLLGSCPIDPVETDDDDIALLQLTSGSTGFPKAVRISHRNIVANAEAMFVGANVDRESDVIVSWLPCFHDMGMTGYLTVPGSLVVCGRVKDVIIMAGRNIYPTDIERAASRVQGVRPGGAAAVRMDAGDSRETFAVAVESNAWEDSAQVRRIEHQVAHEVVTEVDVRPRNVVVLEPGLLPKTPSGKLRRSHASVLVG
jgi:acyl-CoA synthetase (AMP-forming)/AMP-acid ligase II